MVEKPYERIYEQYVPRQQNSFSVTPVVWAEKADYLYSNLTGDLLISSVDAMHQKLYTDLSGDLRGNGQQLSQRETDLSTGHNYAVTVPIAITAEDVFIFVTKRTSTLEVDPGHISFPGGRLEPGENFREAAFRESKEEIGLHAADIKKDVFIGFFERPLSELQRGYQNTNPDKDQKSFDISSDVSGNGHGASERENMGFTAPSSDGRQKIAAFVVFIDPKTNLVANKDEVEDIFKLPLRSLLLPGAAWNEIWTDSDGYEREINFFDNQAIMGKNLIWGLTARIIATIMAEVYNQQLNK
ncbi:MAG: CoA pyrophosphatase [Firmicutes bacterium]|nr:CoA pyrophosphatase [Bacillota bacterium]